MSNRQNIKVMLISPFKLRHRFFASTLLREKIQVCAVINVENPNRLGNSLTLSSFLNLILSIYESIKFGRANVDSLSIYRVHSFQDPKLFEVIESLNPNLLVVYGGKVIPQTAIEKFNVPCINVHGSILPGYRGLDSYWWSIVESRPELRGYSIHFIDSGIDTGNLLRVIPYSKPPHGWRKYCSWRIWIAQDSAREISDIIERGDFLLSGISHSKKESVYRSRINLRGVLQNRCNWRQFLRP